MRSQKPLNRCLPVMPYYGGKRLLAGWVNDHLPPARAYIEVFTGSAAVGLARPRSPIEVFNDVDAGVANLYRVIQSDAEELAWRLRYTLKSRRDHEECCDSERAGQNTDPIEWARRHLVLIRQSFASGFAGSWGYARRGGGGSFHGVAELVQPFAKRMRDATIENRHFRDLIGKYRHLGDDTAWYFDPPYVFDTRKTGKVYKHEMTDAEHEELLSLITGLSGMVALSGYPSAMYDRALADWVRIERDVACLASNFNRGGKPRRTECLWLNPAAQKRLQTALRIAA